MPRASTLLSDVRQRPPSCYESDIMGAMVDGTRPLFSPVPETDLVSLPVFAIEINELTLDSSTTAALLVGTGLMLMVTNPLLAQTLRNMRGLLTDLLHIEDSRIFSPEMLLFTTKRTFIEYPLLSLSAIHASAPLAAGEQCPSRGGYFLEPSVSESSPELWSACEPAAAAEGIIRILRSGAVQAHAVDPRDGGRGHHSGEDRGEGVVRRMLEEGASGVGGPLVAGM